jgi:hypothetical protein
VKAISKIKRDISATTIFLSFHIPIADIYLSFGSIAIHNHVYPKTDLITISSITYSEMLLL